MMRLFATLFFLAACQPEPVTFTEVQTEVLSRSCAFSTCHGASAGTGGLTLDGTADDYDRLVNAASVGTGKVLVAPGDVEGSYLFDKLTNAPGIVGEEMPPGAGSLDPEPLELIRQWIEDGALP